MKLPKARGPGRQVGADQLGEVDPDLGPDLGLPFDLQATRQPGGAWTKWAPAVAGVDGLGDAANGQQGRPGGGALGNQGIGRMGAEALRYAVDPGRVAEIPQNGQAGGLPGLTQEPGFGRFIVALERLGPTHQWPPWPRTSLLRWGPSGARPVRLIWLPPGGGRPLQGVRPGSDSQVRRTNTSRPCQGRPGAYHVPFGGHQNEAAVDHLQDVEGDSPFLTRSRPMRASTAGGGYRRRRGRIPRRDQSRADPTFTVWPGGGNRRLKAPFSSANRPDCVRPRSEVEDHEGENGKQLASLRLLSLGLPVVWAKKVLDISGKIFEHLSMMDSVIRLFNRSYRNCQTHPKTA